MIGDSIRAVIDLLKIRKEEKKLDIDIAKGPLDIRKTKFELQKAPLDITKAALEIEKAEREKAQATRLLVPPDEISISDIQKLDPRARRVRQVVEAHAYSDSHKELRLPAPASPPLSRIGTLITVVLVAFCLYCGFEFSRWLYQLIRGWLH